MKREDFFSFFPADLVFYTPGAELLSRVARRATSGASLPLTEAERRASYSFWSVGIEKKSFLKIVWGRNR